MLFQILRMYSLLRRDQRGVTALEYAVVAGVIITVVVAAFGVLGGDISSAISTIGGKLTTAAG